MERITLTKPGTPAWQQALATATTTLAQGGLVVYPTETVYGLAVDATNTEAVSNLIRYKERPAGKAISVLVATEEAATELVEINAMAQRVAAGFLPGPVTVVCKDRGKVDSRLISEFNTLGIRISSHPFAAALAQTYGKPLTATSANAAGAARPYNIDRLLARLSPAQLALLDLVVDAGELPHNEPSTVIDTTTEVQTLLRSGEQAAALAPPYYAKSEEETKAHAAALVTSLRHVLQEKPLIFALEGEMGMGKTQFAKGVAAALGVTEPVTSPTYTLVKEYQGDGVRFVHIDLWRLAKVVPDELGLAEYLQPGTVLVVEWSEPIIAYLRTLSDVVVQRLQFSGDREREIRLVEL